MNPTDKWLTIDRKFHAVSFTKPYFISVHEIPLGLQYPADAKQIQSLEVA